jgi:hypothetical protein
MAGRPGRTPRRRVSALHPARRGLVEGLRRLPRSGGRIWIPRRLGELLAAAAILPLGAVVTMAVAAFSAPAAVAVQGPPLSSASALLRIHLPPVSDPVSAGSPSLTPPSLTALPAVPVLSPLEQVDGTTIPADTYTAAEVEAIITSAADADGVSPSWMISTAECESTLRPNAYNPSGPYYGIFQFLMSTFKAHGGTDIWDPVQQSQIAASMFASGDSSAWPVCSHR